jgi:uncharacterized protein (DUF885 family)
MNRPALATALAALMIGASACATPASGPATPPAATAQAPTASQTLAAVITDYEAFLKRHDPFGASQEGDEAAKSRLPDLSRQGELARRPELVALSDRLAAIDVAALSPAEAQNHAFATWLITRAIEGIDLDVSRMAFNSEGGFGQSAAYIAGSARLTDRDDVEAWLTRLENMGPLFDATLANARRGLDTGLLQSRSVVESALLLAETDVALTAATDPLLRPTANLPASLPEGERRAYQARAEAVVRDHIQPRRLAWRDFLKDDYLPVAPETPGLVHRPGGRDIYAWLVRGYTTTDLTPEQVHQIGLDEVARIRARMEIEMRAAGWTGDFPGFLTFLRTDPQFYASSREELLEKASEMSKRADDGLPALFGTLPRLPYGVRPVPAEIEANYTTGRYFSGSMRNGIAGGYMVNTSKLDQRPLYELPALTLHEAVPGHHLQIALQQEAADQPYFRRDANVTAFTEGWGLYAEFLGEEMGFYRTPYERFGRLSYEMWRACRLVADTGMHWMGWSVDQARACFTDNSALAPHNIETELQRYVGWPGQATAYKIGEIRLRQIRTRAETALGEDFDVRAFHDALLVPGPLPLALLDAHMDRWIETQRAKD